ncbi:GNAT family N-acetyltransferase ['Paenibacillus yunnanensis' Narsing Rao et al. 2020]|uniref:GNAT family N-acetyltransferase n=1 Tax=Paenibacillus tengchongensis TaxID=2608684 RepID=UPI00124E0DD4|nr:GNAT family N-acetyltransferase [Paenibacillus tengchongensis]
MGNDNPLILMDIPESLESERLLIRAPQWGDGAAVCQAAQESIGELRPWMPWTSRLTPEDSEASVRRSRLEFLERSDLRLMLILKESGQFIGGSGLHRIHWEARKFEIGYWIHTAWAGQGLVTEAVEAITRFAVTQLQANRLEIRCDARNERSAGVARRSGFTLEGILRNDQLDVDGALRDTMVFSKVRGVEF